MVALQAHGHTIAWDWCSVMDRADELGSDVDLPTELGLDARAVEIADAVVWLGPRLHSVGAYVELGFAAGRGVRVYASVEPGSVAHAWCVALGGGLRPVYVYASDADAIAAAVRS